MVISDESGHKATSLLIVRLIIKVEHKFLNVQLLKQYDKPTNPYIDPAQK